MNREHLFLWDILETTLGHAKSYCQLSDAYTQLLVDTKRDPWLIDGSSM